MTSGATEPAPAAASVWERAAALRVALAGLAVAYGLLALALPPRVFWSPDEGARLLQLLSYRWQGGLVAQLPYGGRDLDPSLRFYPRRLPRDHPAVLQSLVYPQPTADGARFNWSPLFPLLSLPPYRLLGARGPYLLPLACGLIAAGLAGALGRLVDRAAAVPAALAVGLASPLAVYSQLFWEHVPVVALCLGALLLLARAPGHLTFAHAGAAACLAGAVALRSESLLLVAVLPPALVLAWSRDHSDRGRPSRAGLVAVALVATALVAAGLLALRFRFSVVPAMAGELFGRAFPRRLAAGWLDPGGDLGPSLSPPLVWVGLAGAVLALGAALLREPARGWALAGGGCLVLAPSLWTLASPDRFRAVHALLLPAPFLVLVALLLRPPPSSRRPATALLAGTTALYLAAGSAAAASQLVGGLEWGNRYLLPLLVLAALAAAAGAVAYARRDGERRPRLPVVTVTVACLITGALYEARGLRELVIAKADLAACREAMLAAPGPVVSDVYWLPAALAERFAAQPLFTLAGREDLAWWVRRVGSRGERFLLVTASDEAETRSWVEAVTGPRLELLSSRRVGGLVVAEVQVGGGT